ncbi:SusC/RagA family TonB-linked outer membrane protein [Parapedobacter koreensis]|uniref:TonB-linked outer membrane protein, SusC/RagA family n=1 Tax=Parapedobacter koreensis TaxID=332977 RepID=A0A1H7RQS9_9SPHI|nr:TonB-dependent receptor [Parapedobacter koreensis]SEL62369.1 TonB-linked outer membrane protein, SusC/RagA family [Parapedobacter koreensis]
MRFNLYRILRCNTLYLFSLIVTTLALSLGSITSGRSYASASDSNQQPSSVTGRVTDEVGDPLTGVTVSIKGTSYAVSTDIDGYYRLQDVPADATVTFSFSGMKYQEIAVSGQMSINVVMLPDVINMDEVVVVGYGTQKRATVTGSVASIQHAEIVQTKNENPLNTLTGRVPGLRVRQQNSEPGVFGTSIDIRGMGNPLVIIDGVPRDNIQRLDPNDIESISVLKDASAAIYGVQAANGVVLVTTKKGAADNTFNMDYSGSMIWQTMAGMPHTISAADYIRLTNELDMNRVNGDGTWRYSQELLDEFLSGERQSTNWNDAVFRNSAPQGQHNLSISSGNSRTQYFTSLGYQFQESFFNSDRGFDYDKFNLRANLTSKLTDDLTFDLKTNATTDQRNRTQFSSNDIIRATWRQISIDPIYANNTAPYYYHTTISEANNPVAWIDQDYVGYIRYQNRSFQSSASLNYQAPFLEGLSAEVFYSYDYNNNQEKNYSQAYEQFRYDESTGTYGTYLMSSPSSIRRDFGEQMLSIYRFSLRYERTFNNSHHINAVAVHEGRRQEGDGFYASRQLRLDLDELFAGDADNQLAYMDPNQRYEYAYQSYIGRLNYDYKGKYLLEAALRADGSSRFPSNARWGFFPSASFGYRISEEGFWKNSFLDIINNLKLRASYGRMGDDSGLNYQFVSGYSYPATATFFGGNFINGAASTGIPNLGITWMESDMFNAGFDMEMWDGMLGVTFDVFRRNRSGMYAYRGDVSSIIGALLPQENLNSDRSEGYELALNHRGTVGNVSYTIGGNLALTRISNRTVVRAADRSHYHNWRNNSQNRYTNIWWGMEAGGQYRSFAEIAEFPVYSSRNELPGNYYHKDWNGDGIIDDMDRHPMGFGPQPLLNYGITGSLSYKGLDFFMLWQGAGMANVYYNEILRQPLWSGYDNTHDRFLDRWRPVDPHANPYDQQTEFIEGRYPMPGSPYPGSESEFSVYNNRYIRLKNAELGYTLPATAIRWVGIRSARVSVGGYNLLTFSPVDFVDPEHPQDQGGYMYPLNRTYNVSLSCKF